MAEQISGEIKHTKTPPAFGVDTIDSLKSPSKSKLDEMMRSQGAGGFSAHSEETTLDSVELEDLILISEEISESEKPIADKIIQAQSTTDAQNPQKEKLVFSIRKIPAGVVLTDRETGDVAGRTDQDTFMLGYWKRPPQRKGMKSGPALFILASMFPDGLRGRKVSVDGKLEIKRRGLLWDGLTSEDLERIKREREQLTTSTLNNT
jgi:hypothetical protein